MVLRFKTAVQSMSPECNETVMIAACIIATFVSINAPVDSVAALFCCSMLAPHVGSERKRYMIGKG